ncbi:MAG: hypothetical protein QN194_13770 [Armatimonadota bacterium]|nr:hypothetical protein [Armatimonadota bacterium]
MYSLTGPTVALVGNGPGEVGGWVLPVARALRARAPSTRLVLFLPPTQFAGGHEEVLARRSGLFSLVIPPGRTVATALGLGAALGSVPPFLVRGAQPGAGTTRDGHRAAQPAGGALLHLGGDLWVSVRLARRLGVPAYAFVETPLIARYARAFRTIFVSSHTHARMLTAAGVPGQVIHVVGDPRLDAVPPRVRERHVDGAPGDGRTVIFLAGSRPHFLPSLLPLWCEAALELRRRDGRARILLGVSPLLDEGAVERHLLPWRPRLADAGIEVARRPAADLLAEADLVVTIPGTTTMEVAAVPVAALVVLPLHLVGVAPLEGLAHYVARLPLVGPRLIRRRAAVVLARERFVSLPNRLAGRAVLPELVGEVTPAQVAEAAAALAADAARLREIEAALREVAGPRGAADRIAARILADLPGAAGVADTAAVQPEVPA